MNKRIQELAEQATTYIKPTENSGEGWIFDKEKFAKNLIDDIQRYDLVDNDSLEQIKRHFGVEE